jgi:hypothetical protein
MAPKKKASAIAGPSVPDPPLPMQTGGGVGTGGGGDIDTGPPQPFAEQSQVDGGAHGAAKSKEKAVLPTGGVATSHNDAEHSKTPTPAGTP